MPDYPPMPVERQYPDEPRPRVKMVGEDGNAFSIMARAEKALRRAGASPEHIERYRREAVSGDYDNLLAVTMRYVDGY